MKSQARRIEIIEVVSLSFAVTSLATAKGGARGLATIKIHQSLLSFPHLSFFDLLLNDMCILALECALLDRYSFLQSVFLSPWHD